MNWFTRVQLPDRFKDMKPDDIEKAFADLEAASTNPPVQARPEESEAYKTLQTRLAETQANLQRLEANPPTIQPPANPDQSQRTSFLEDEDRAFAERATPIINMTMNNAAMMARQLATQDLKDSIDPFDRESNVYILKNYSKEVDDLYGSMPLQAKTSPEAFKNVIGVIKHRHFSDVVKAIQGNKTLFESAGGGSSAANQPGSQRTAESELTPGELRAASKFKMSPADYLKSKKGLKIAHETTGYAEVKV